MPGRFHTVPQPLLLVSAEASMSSSAPTCFSRPPVLQAFQAMQSKGCKPDSIVYNAIIDALWDTGIVWAQQHAAVLY